MYYLVELGMYHVSDNEGRETRCETYAEAQVVADTWYRCGSERVSIVPVGS